MCGIVGFYQNKQVLNKNILKKMADTINYRGPDDEGYFIINNNSGYQIGLAHKRLSIIDLSPNGHQPMSDENNNITVIFNGEIYNFLDLKKELINKGYSFRSSSDTEVIINAYLEWGKDFITKCNGMFAIALYDKRIETLFLYRDRLGVKPLYYSLLDSNLVFASEIKPFLEYPGFTKNLDFYSLTQYLCFGYINSPYSIFKEIKKVIPGHYIEFKNGYFKEYTYWSIDQRFLDLNKNRKIKSENEYIEELEQLLLDATKIRMISDVPLGAFLSGGIDSSLVCALMQNISNIPIKTFTIGFNEKDCNEADFAREVAKHLKTDHYEEILSIDEAKNLINKVPVYYDEPFGDSSQLPTMLVSRIARKKVTVALSGDGADEMFFGYKYFNTVKKLKKYQNLFSLISSIPYCVDLLTKIDKRFAKLKTVKTDEGIINADFYRSKYFIDGLTSENVILDNNFIEILKLTNDIEEKLSLNQLINFLPGDILTKVDRASMSVSLEARSPFLDFRVCEYALSLPPFMKHKGSKQKYILKKILYKYVPKELIERPKKGFGIPISKWLQNDLKEDINYYLSEEFIKKQNIFNYNKIKIIRDELYKRKDLHSNFVIWWLYMFQLWYEKYMV